MGKSDLKGAMHDNDWLAAEIGTRPCALGKTKKEISFQKFQRDRPSPYFPLDPSRIVAMLIDKGNSFGSGMCALIALRASACPPFVDEELPYHTTHTHTHTQALCYCNPTP